MIELAIECGMLGGFSSSSLWLFRENRDLGGLLLLSCRRCLHLGLGRSGALIALLGALTTA